MCNFESLGSPTIQFAEDNLPGCIAQPANTFSNLAFVFVAMMIFYSLRKEKFSSLYLFPVIYILIGLSSGCYHASSTFVGQFFDFFSIYMLGSLLIYSSAKILSNRYKNILSISSVLITVLLGVILWFAPYMRIYIAFLELFLLIYIEFNVKQKYPNYNSKNFLSALLIFIIAFGIWLLDVTYLWDLDKIEHIINGHAIWHILTSVSLYFVFLHYKLNKKLNS
jgi:hypothetical protein